MKISRHKALAALLGIGLILLAKSALGQGTTDPQGMLQIFADASVNWQSAIFPYALNLFKLLAAVDFAWMCISNALEKSDFQALVAAIIKKLMVIGIFYALLVFAPQWFPAIIQSFVQIGGAASATATPLNPSDILKMGATISGTLLSAAATTTSLLSPQSFSGAIALIFAAAVIVISYVVITVHFVMAMVESYVVIGAGYIFLGFGGSRWTSPFAEKYVSQVVSVGTRLMVLYLVIGLGQQFATQWIAAAQVAANGASANLSLAWTLASQVAIYAVICWTVPKLVSNVIGGTLSASAGDAVGVGVAAATATLAGAAALSGVGAPAAGAAAVSSVASAAGATSAATGAASVGSVGAAAGTGAGAGGAASTTAGAAIFGNSSLAPAAASGAGGFGGGGGSSISASRSSAVHLTPMPPASAMASPTGGAPSRASASRRVMPVAGREVPQPPPPAHALDGSKAQAGLNRAKEFIQGVHGSLPSDGAVSSGPGLSIGHPPE